MEVMVLEVLVMVVVGAERLLLGDRSGRHHRTVRLTHTMTGRRSFDPFLLCLR